MHLKSVHLENVGGKEITKDDIRIVFTFGRECNRKRYILYSCKRRVQT